MKGGGTATVRFGMLQKRDFCAMRELLAKFEALM